MENGQLRSDLTGTLKDFQQDALHQQALDEKLQELDEEKFKAKEERDRAEQLRAAFNVDKKAMMDRMKDMEVQVRDKAAQANEVQRCVSLIEQNNQQQRGELNFWNGKVTNMKCDLDFHQDFNTKLADENNALKAYVECLRKHLEM